MPKSAVEFARAWGESSLVRLPANLAAAPIPKDDRDFLVRAEYVRHDFLTELLYYINTVYVNSFCDTFSLLC